jgi:hypothetical protein
MPNITLSMDEKLVQAGRRYAQEHNTSLNNLIRETLAEKVIPKSDKWLEEMLDAMKKAGGDSKGWKWNRQELYDV